jgi:hypothetical protein
LCTPQDIYLLVTAAAASVSVNLLQQQVLAHFVATTMVRKHQIGGSSAVNKYMIYQIVGRLYRYIVEPRHFAVPPHRVGIVKSSCFKHDLVSPLMILLGRHFVGSPAPHDESELPAPIKWTITHWVCMSDAVLV